MEVKSTRTTTIVDTHEAEFTGGEILEFLIKAAFDDVPTDDLDVYVDAPRYWNDESTSPDLSLLTVRIVRRMTNVAEQQLPLQTEAAVRAVAKERLEETKRKAEMYGR